MLLKKFLSLIPLSIILALVLSFAFSFPAYAAHPDHDTDAHSEEVSSGDQERLEKMVQILQQLVVLLTEYKKLYGTLPLPAVTHSEADEHAHTDTPVSVVTDEHEDGDEHDEHSESSTSEAKLVIEIEPHMGKTHAHMRYTDKPEEMFFVDVAITDEDGIVAAIVAKTGMSADVVRNALKYMQ
jgi:predicted DsbA family dithiol-disulfide isomerase